MDTYVTLWPESAAFPLLTTLTFVPLAAMVAILCSRSATVAMRFGLSGTLLAVLLSIYLLVIFDSGNPGIHLVEQVHFAGLSYSVGVDGANILFIPLTAILTLLGLVYTLITRHATDRLFIACLLGYEGVLIGAFAALNVMQFWLWCMLELIPVA
ncbi:MAG: NADH:quinone oxidoreductase, partial [Methylococcaceae bacterium]